MVKVIIGDQAGEEKLLQEVCIIWSWRGQFSLEMRIKMLVGGEMEHKLQMNSIHIDSLFWTSKLCFSHWLHNLFGFFPY